MANIVISLIKSEAAMRRWRRTVPDSSEGGIVPSVVAVVYISIIPVSKTGIKKIPARQKTNEITKRNQNFPH